MGTHGPKAEVDRTTLMCSYLCKLKVLRLIQSLYVCISDHLNLHSAGLSVLVILDNPATVGMYPY